MKSIGELSTNELGMLFPIFLEDYNPDWPLIFISEKDQIEAVIGLANIISVEHIGSTAIPGLKANPTIDILLEILDDVDNHFIISNLQKIGYEYIPKPENPAPHMMFAKGYTLIGFQGQAYHIHVRYKGDWDEIYFRDFLIKEPNKALEYTILKEKLALTYKNDREAYTEGRTEFIKIIAKLLRQS
jgi:GrpB-like predicted nucleotidyltransferase (UPF0157 family)